MIDSEREREQIARRSRLQEFKESTMPQEKLSVETKINTD
jgi:hypothetical protein